MISCSYNYVLCVLHCTDEAETVPNAVGLSSVPHDY